jgi:hypothetical protein
MKTFVSLSIALALAASAGAQTPAPAPAPAKPLVRIDLDAPATQTAPKAAPKKDDKKKKEEPPAKIDGVVVARGTGFLGVQVVGGHFKVSFYDAKKKPVPPDVASAVLRWKVNYSLDPEHTQLTPGGGPNSLTSEKVIRQPYSFRLTMLLFKGASEDETPETFMVDFQQ